MRHTYSISGISIVTPLDFVKDSSIIVENGKIAEIGVKADENYKAKNRLYLYPALINVHDHLRGNYLPKVGPKAGTFYLNWSPWDDDLHQAPVFYEREKNSIEDLYLLSAYKNIFSGVVTVNDHFPHYINDPIIPTLPLHVITEYTLEHSAQSFSLKWGNGIEAEHKRAIAKNWPFIIHCEEGFDAETQTDIERLEKLGSLDDHTVLIHCIGFSDRDIEKTRKAGATIVWCPGSNMFMFNTTCKIRKIVAAGINTCIGTDATHSGSPNLLEEMRYARAVYRKMYRQTLDAKTMLEMVTINPARALRMQDRIGSIETGKNADFLAIRPRCEDPYEAILACQMEDIEFLSLDGNPVIASREFEGLFKARKADGTKVKLRGTDRTVTGYPVELMKRIHENVGFAKTFDFIPLDI
jgi:5-methylthioadenosine/S-adenosylhomocysteine deaminase